MSEEISIPNESVVINKIHLLRNQKVMLDVDLAELYGVETKQLKRAVRRNLVRFPDDFMFELNASEISALRYQIGTSKVEGREAHDILQWPSPNRVWQCCRAFSTPNALSP